MKKITIEFDGNWVLSHRNDDVLPIELLKKKLEKINGIVINATSLTNITIAIEQNCEIFETFDSYIMEYIRKTYPTEELNCGVIFASSDELEEDVDEEYDISFYQDFDSSIEDVDSGLKEIDGGLLDRIINCKIDEKIKEKTATNSDTNTDTNVDDKLKSLVGALEFKKLLKEIESVASEIKRTNTYEIFRNRCYLFSIGDGCGLTTYLELLAQVIEKSGLCHFCSSPVQEERLDAYKESFDPFDNAVHALRCGDESKLKILCIDISEWMGKTDNRFFKQFLRMVEKHANEFIVVFRVPFVDKDVLSRIQFSITDLLSVKTVSFPPLNQQEIKRCAEAEFKKFGFTMTNMAWKCYFECIMEEKSDGKFYGINTVKKVVRDFIYHKQLSNVQKNKQNNAIAKNDITGYCRHIGESDLSGMAQLDKLIGNESIKKRINEILAQIELSIRDSSIQAPCIHMRFVGNPGTGKTTVARIIGKILKEKGVLRVGAFFEYGGRDFCGRYIGETAPKTSSICRDALGSVLFIDEAYSLFRGDDDSRDFGREAIDTLIAEMENHRNDFIVIMAGYTDDMDKLMKGNLGLASRMPYTIEFPNFTREQLYDIYVSMVTEKFKCDSQLFEAAHEYFLSLPDEVISAKEFANARFVRNLFERTWAKAAMRCQLDGKTQILIMKEDFEHASADKEFILNTQKKIRIGF